MIIFLISDQGVMIIFYLRSFAVNSLQDLVFQGNSDNFDSQLHLDRVNDLESGSGILEVDKKMIDNDYCDYIWRI